jgi:hypothetical protein
MEEAVTVIKVAVDELGESHHCFWVFIHIEGWLILWWPQHMSTLTVVLVSHMANEGTHVGAECFLVSGKQLHPWVVS